MKKIVLIFVSIFSFFYFENVKALEACTDTQIKDARVTLNVSVFAEGVSIPSLGRTASSGKANIYKMTMTNNSNGSTSNAFCLDSGKSARTGITYKIDHEVDSGNWKKLYQYGMEYKNDDQKYIVAQAALWLLREQKSWSLYLQSVAEDIYVNRHCETILRSYGLSETQAQNTCSTASTKDDSTNFIYSQVFRLCTAKGNCSSAKFIASGINNAVNHFNNYSKQYSGRLFYWVSTSGDYQAMLAPLTCGGEEVTPERRVCTDNSGRTHDYTDEYNACVLTGKTGAVCKSELDNKYCPSGKKYTVKTTGSDAVCTNSSSNVGSYHEYVEESSDGLAIPGKGEPEKVVNSYCNLYCLETTAQQIFPGNVRPSVSAGTYLIWPTSDATISSIYKNQYPLKFYGEKTCYVVMAGSENTVNKTNITEVYNTLTKDANSKNKYGSFARKDYETTRLGSGCDSTYSNTSGVCSSSYRDYQSKKKSYEDYNNSDEYKNAVKSKKAKEDKEASCNRAANEAKNACNSANASCKGKGCSAALKKCLDAVDDDCDENTSSEDRIIEERNKRLKSYEDAEKVYNSCQAEKNACNDYTNAVNKVVSFANEIKSCATYNLSCSGSSCELYNYTTNIDLSWGDPEYGKTITDAELEKTKNYSSTVENNTSVTTNVNSSQGFKEIKSNTSRLITEVKGITDNRKVVMSVNVTYSLPTSGSLLYNYVVKRDNKIISQTSKPSADSNYATIGFSNLPVSFDAKSSTPYNLTLSNIRFGDNGGQYSPNDYTCNYEATKATPSSCVCPTGTMNEGKDLSNIIIDKGLTCSEAQKAFCDTEPTTCPDDASIDLSSCLKDSDYFACYDKYCRSNDTKRKYCPEDSSIDLSACLNNHSYDTCYNLFCTGGINPGGYKCKNSLGVDGPMDITSCVMTKMSQGLSEAEAVDTCDALVCPLSGLRIIYRTISLENPFPSKLADAKITQTGLSVGMFNDNVKGRYPGTNWNDQKLVKNHILNVTRGGVTIDGSNIYQNEPLYTFVLTPSNISAIRKYNQSQISNGGYADYDLDCRISNSKACVSEFIHNTDLSGLTSGLCANATSRSNFYTCSGD